MDDERQKTGARAVYEAQFKVCKIRGDQLIEEGGETFARAYFEDSDNWPLLEFKTLLEANQRLLEDGYNFRIEYFQGRNWLRIFDFVYRDPKNN